jgi:hypothetical protein
LTRTIAIPRMGPHRSGDFSPVPTPVRTGLGCEGFFTFPRRLAASTSKRMFEKSFHVVGGASREQSFNTNSTT